MNDNQDGFRQRDIDTLRVLGIFFSTMGALVLIASYAAIGNTPALIVNVCSGLAIGSVGVGMIVISRRMARSGRDR